MVGVTPEQLLQMKPAGWIVRPHPPGIAGFRMLSPGNLPGQSGSISWHDATPGWQQFDRRPDPRTFVLNAALEHPMLTEVLRQWAQADLSSGVAAAPEVSALAGATESLVREGLVCVYRDDLDDDAADLLLLAVSPACAAVSDGRNWWRDELVEDPDPARSVFVLQVTDRHRRASVHT